MSARWTPSAMSAHACCSCALAASTPRVKPPSMADRCGVSWDNWTFLAVPASLATQTPLPRAPVVLDDRSRRVRRDARAEGRQNGNVSARRRATPGADRGPDARNLRTKSSLRVVRERSPHVLTPAQTARSRADG